MTIKLWYSADWETYVVTKTWKEDNKERGVDIVLTKEEMKTLLNELLTEFACEDN